jgi:hypothetical protein
VQAPFVDLELAVGLDANLDGAVTWGETEAALDRISAYVENTLRIEAGGACTLALTGAAPATRDGEAMAALDFAADCPDSQAPIRVASSLFAGIDPSSRTLLRLNDGARTETRVLRPSSMETRESAARPEAAPAPTPNAAPVPAPEPASASHASGFLSFVLEGLHHLFGGPDHMLFLLLLIAPGVQQAARLRDMLVAILLPITGFTAGHALTLTAAASSLIQVPSGVVEALIALTILLTAIDNVKRFLPGPRTAIAMAFGLVHGLGFAGALGALDLQGWPLFTALLGFNLGIEAGQAIIALAIAPILFLARTPVLRYRLLPHGLSIAAGLMALVWIAERTGLTA